MGKDLLVKHMLTLRPSPLSKYEGKFFYKRFWANFWGDALHGD